MKWILKKKMKYIFKKKCIQPCFVTAAWPVCTVYLQYIPYTHSDAIKNPPVETAQGNYWNAKNSQLAVIRDNGPLSLAVI